MMLAVGTTLFGVFFFLTLFVQDVWGYSRSGPGRVLPLTVAVLITTVAATRLMPRIGARRCCWPAPRSAPAACSGCPGDRARDVRGRAAGPVLVTGAGLGLLSCRCPGCPVRCRPRPTPEWPTSLLNTGRQVGGSIGLAVLGTVAWTVVANTSRPGPRGRARLIITRWPPASTGPSWLPPGSRC